jgi:hypothetical protein
MLLLAIIIAVELLALIAIGVCLVANTNVLTRALGSGAEDWPAAGGGAPKD